MSKLNDIKNEITELQLIIERQQDLLRVLGKQMENFELDAYDYEGEYQSMLEDAYPYVDICGMTMSPVAIIREMDPTAYRCGLIDYVDGIDKEDTDEYRDLERRRDDTESYLDALELDLEDLMSEFDEIQSEQVGE